MSHPSESSLALLAGGDLGVWARWRMRLHLSGCERCRRELEQFEFSRERLRFAPEEVPGVVNWASLAAEMKANIRLGLAAGECVVDSDHAASGSRLGWKPALALAGLTLVIVSGWLVQLPRPLQAPRGTTLQATSSGIELQQRNNRSLAVLYRAKGEDPVLLSVNTDGSVRARYVDSDTGQVTIANVYTE